MTAKPSTDTKVVITDILSSWGGYTFDAWMAMLFLGVAHSVDHAIPAFGYWLTLFGVWILTNIVGDGTNAVFQRVKSLTPLYGKKVGSPIEELAKKIADLSKGAK